MESSGLRLLNHSGEASTNKYTNTQIHIMHTNIQMINMALAHISDRGNATELFIEDVIRDATHQKTPKDVIFALNKIASILKKHNENIASLADFVDDIIEG
jgi:hypothetical protein